jgi:hypothetical protein
MERIGWEGCGRRIVMLLGFWLALLLALPGLGVNPRVSLRVENATASEAGAALGRAAGVWVEVVRPAGEGKGLILQERATFDWDDATFGQALRQLCERYGLHPTSHPGGGYLLSLDTDAPRRPAKPLARFEKDGVRLDLVHLKEGHPERGFEADPARPEGERIALYLIARLQEQDPAALAGVAHVRAKDDRGRFLDDEAGRYFDSSPDSGLYPDEWSGRITLTQPSAGARKLQWVEGDLRVYRMHRTTRHAFPLPLDGAPVRKVVGDAVLEVLYQGPLLPDLGREAAAAPGQPKQLTEVRARIFTSSGKPLAPASHTWTVIPRLVGASGKWYGGSITTFSGDSSSQPISLTAADMPERAVRVAFDIVENAQPEKLVTFRLTDIPLPPDAVRVPEHPYAERGGGVLVARVQIGGKPAGGGTLLVGLSRRTDAGKWSTIRWTELPVDEKGTARLEDRKPGMYRLRQVYRPARGRSLPPNGRWLNGQVEVQVVRGKETVIPPLGFLSR